MAPQSLDWHEQLAAVIEFSSDAIITLDSDARVTSWNPGAERLFGHNAAHMLGRPVSALMVSARAGVETYRLLRVLARGQRVTEYETVIQRSDGTPAAVAVSLAPIHDDHGPHGAALIARDISHRKRGQERQLHRIRQARLRAAVSGALGHAGLPLPDMLQACAAAMVRHCGVALARIWTLNEPAQVLELQASAGLYTHLTGPDARIPVGAFNVGRIAASREPQFTNDLAGDPHVGNPEWVGEHALVAFAGYPLQVEDHVVGVCGVFSQDRLSDETLETMASATDTIAQGIERKRTEEALRESEEAERKSRLTAEALSDANQKLTRTLNLDEVLEALLDALARVAPYDSASVIAVEDEFRSLAMRGYERWTEPERVREIVRQLGNSRVPHQMFASRRGCIITDTRNSPEWRYFSETAYVRSWLGVPLFAGTQLIGLYSLDKAEPGFFTHEHLRLAEALAGPAAVAIQNARLFGEVTKGRRHLKALSQRVVQVQEAERRQIARELHDEIGQSLTGLKLTLETLPRVAPEAREQKLRDAQALVMDLMTRVRELSLSLRPPVLDDLGLLAGLVALFDRYTAQTHVEVVFSQHDLDRRLPAEIETAAFRVVQEALTNVARHARVKQVNVRIRVMPDSLLGLVYDEGVGFDATEAMRQPTGGLSGMKERVALLGGWLWIDSGPAKGTRVIMNLPRTPVRSRTDDAARAAR